MISRQEAIDLFHSDDLIGIGMAADAVRRKLHPHGIATYIIDRNINYTNFCTEYCSFCAFYRPMGHAEGYVHPKEVIFDKIQETIDLGGTGILMQGGLHPELGIEWYEDLLRSIKARFGDRIWCHCFSAPEIVNIAEISSLSIRDTDRAATGCGPSIHSGRRRGDSRRRSPAPDQPAEIVVAGLDRRASRGALAGHANHCHHDVRVRGNHRAAHEPPRHRAADPGRDGWIHRLHPVGVPAREHVAGPLRQRGSDGGRIPARRWRFRGFTSTTSRTSRSSWVTPRLKTCQFGLRFGGNDVGSIMIEENVVSAAGAHHRATEEELRRMIRDAGFIPKQRDTLYRTYFLN